MEANHGPRDLDEVQALRDLPGKLGVTGSISVAQQLMTAGLVDEYRLIVYPGAMRRVPERPVRAMPIRSRARRSGCGLTGVGFGRVTGCGQRGSAGSRAAIVASPVVVSDEMGLEASACWDVSPCGE